MKANGPVWKTKRVKASRISRTVIMLNEAWTIFPAVKSLLFEVFWLLFALLEIVRVLRTLL
jgi:hypothetical protein